MELDKIRIFIKKIRAMAPHEEGQELADRFEEFIELNAQKDDLGHNPEFVQKLADSHKRFWMSYYQVATSYGIPLEELTQRLATLKEAEEKIESGTAIAAHKKLKNSQEKVRV